MPRETIEERQARLMPGARWIRAERERRAWSGRELARRLSIGQDRISAYERAQDEPSPDVARGLAREFGLSELEVWRSLRLPLPRELEQQRPPSAEHAATAAASRDPVIARIRNGPSTADPDQPVGSAERERSGHPGDRTR